MSVGKLASRAANDGCFLGVTWVCSLVAASKLPCVHAFTLMMDCWSVHSSGAPDATSRFWNSKPGAGHEAQPLLHCVRREALTCALRCGVDEKRAGKEKNKGFDHASSYASEVCCSLQGPPCTRRRREALALTAIRFPTARTRAEASGPPPAGARQSHPLASAMCHILRTAVTQAPSSG